MRIIRNSIDSEVLGRDVLEVSDVVDPADLEGRSGEWEASGRRPLVVVKIPADRVDLIQGAEELGFRFSECQLRLRRRLTGRSETPGEGFEHLEVRKNDDLEEVLVLVGGLQWLDRFSLDPELGPELARRRYRAYVRRSFEADDEVVLAVRDRSSSRIVAFSTFRHASPTEVCGLLGGVSPDFQRTGLAVVHYQLDTSYLLARGVRVVTTSVSALHHAAVHSHLNYMGYRVTDTWVVLRKLHG